MNGRERLRREDPERTEPFRDWSNLYRPADSWPFRDPPEAPEAKEDESWSDVATEGVRLGYQVIEEQIRQGQRVAEQLSDASYGPAAMGGDVRETAERVIRYSADLVALWFDFLNSTMANGDVLRAFAASWQAPASGSPATPPAGAGANTTPVSIEICSSRPVRVTLDLKTSAAGRPLATHGLRALEAEKPALTEVTFEPGPDGGLPSLRLRVPEGQPPGLYSGVVVDRRSGELLGTLSALMNE